MNSLVGSLLIYLAGR